MPIPLPAIGPTPPLPTMKKLILTALALGAGLTACSGEKDTDAEESNTQNTEGEANAQLASFKIDGMT